MAPKLLTTTEASEILRTPIQTLRHWRARNYGPISIKIGNRVLYREDDVNTWIEAQLVTAIDRREAANQ